MPVLCPTLVAADLDLGGDIQTAAEEAACSRLRRCTFSDCRQHIAWQKPGLLILVAVTSMQAARRHISYEAFHGVHLYVYLALAFGYLHQLTIGTDFVAKLGQGRSLARK